MDIDIFHNFVVTIDDECITDRVLAQAKILRSFKKAAGNNFKGRI